MTDVLHPINKTKYLDGSRVEFTLDGNVSKTHRGAICGIASEGVIDEWIIRLDNKLETWAFSTIVLPHTFIRLEGSNSPFLCERKTIHA